MTPVLFFHTSVAGQHAGSLERRPQLVVRSGECPRNSVPDGIGLTRDSPADHFDDHVVLSQCIGQFQWLLHGCAMNHSAAEVFAELFAVNRNNARTGIQPHSRHRAFSPPGPVVVLCLLNHSFVPFWSGAVKSRFRSVCGSRAGVRFQRKP
jgi:hypothetical protein